MEDKDLQQASQAFDNALFGDNTAIQPPASEEASPLQKITAEQKAVLQETNPALAEFMSKAAATNAEAEKYIRENKEKILSEDYTPNKYDVDNKKDKDMYTAFLSTKGYEPMQARYSSSVHNEEYGIFDVENMKIGNTLKFSASFLDKSEYQRMLAECGLTRDSIKNINTLEEGEKIYINNQLYGSLQRIMNNNKQTVDVYNDGAVSAYRKRIETLSDFKSFNDNF